jgi:hypothetical protein
MNRLVFILRVIAGKKMKFYQENEILYHKFAFLGCLVLAVKLMRDANEASHSCLYMNDRMQKTIIAQCTKTRKSHSKLRFN